MCCPSHPNYNSLRQISSAVIFAIGWPTITNIISLNPTVTRTAITIEVVTIITRKWKSIAITTVLETSLGVVVVCELWSALETECLGTATQTAIGTRDADIVEKKCSRWTWSGCWIAAKGKAPPKAEIISALALTLTIAEDGVGQMIARITCTVADQTLTKTAGSYCLKARIADTVTTVPTGITHIGAVHFLQTIAHLLDQKISLWTTATTSCVNLIISTSDAA